MLDGAAEVVGDVAAGPAHNPLPGQTLAVKRSKRSRG